MTSPQLQTEECTKTRCGAILISKLMNSQQMSILKWQRKSIELE